MLFFSPPSPLSILDTSDQLPPFRLLPLILHLFAEITEIPLAYSIL